MNMNPMQYAMNLINSNPQIANNPRAKELLGVIQSGDATKGEQIANNLCQSFGMTKEQAIAAARDFFHI